MLINTGSDDKQELIFKSSPGLKALYNANVCNKNGWVHISCKALTKVMLM